MSLLCSQPAPLFSWLISSFSSRIICYPGSFPLCLETHSIFFPLKRSTPQSSPMEQWVKDPVLSVAQVTVYGTGSIPGLGTGIEGKKKKKITPSLTFTLLKFTRLLKLLSFIQYSFFGGGGGIWRFPGQGVNQSCSCWPIP